MLKQCNYCNFLNKIFRVFENSQSPVALHPRIPDKANLSKPSKPPNRNHAGATDWLTNAYQTAFGHLL